ncbi:MAG: glycosyl transferase, partial [Flavobacterium sp.]
MIKIYKIDSMNYTPFDPNFDQGDFEYLVSAGLSITKNLKEADLFAAYDTKKLKRFMLKNPFKKPFLLWTNEPRLSQIKLHTYRPYRLLPKVNVMNVYTGDVFINNVTYQKKRFTAASKLELLSANFKLDNRKVAALMSYYNAGRNSALFIDGVNIDLVRKRSEIGIYGHEHDLLDIYGKGWPEGMSKEDS